jgi:hypothetical protein
MNIDTDFNSEHFDEDDKGCENTEEDNDEVSMMTFKDESMPNKTYKEELIEEWLNNGYWIGDSIDKDLVPEEVMNRMADFWIAKLETYADKRVEEIRGEIEKIKDKYGWMPLGVKDDPWNKALKAVLALPSLNTKTLSDEVKEN